MTTAIAFTVGDLVSIVAEGIEKIGVVEQVYKGDYLLVRWVIRGTRKMRAWSWIPSDWVFKRYFLIIETDELSIKQNRKAKQERSV